MKFKNFFIFIFLFFSFRFFSQEKIILDAHLEAKKKAEIEEFKKIQEELMIAEKTDDDSVNNE